LVVPDGTEQRRRVAVQLADLVAALRAEVGRRRTHVATLSRHLRDPRRAIAEQRQQTGALADRGRRAMQGAVRMARARLAAAAERLQALSPLAVLERGYAIARREDGNVIRAAAEVALDDVVDITFRRGGARARIVSRRD
jgi:exodeoxyribonuclease VII large subunit